VAASWEVRPRGPHRSRFRRSPIRRRDASKVASRCPAGRRDVVDVIAYPRWVHRYPVAHHE
jgi:hypothetical protein